MIETAKVLVFLMLCFLIVVQINPSNHSAMLKLINSLQYKDPFGSFDDNHPKAAIAIVICKLLAITDSTVHCP